MIGDFISGIANIIDNIGDCVDAVVDALNQVATAINYLYSALVDFNDEIDALNACVTTGEIDGLPVAESIALYHYLVGDRVFYFTYFLILFGCLSTLYKLGLLVYHGWQTYKEGISGGGTTSALSALISKFK